MPTKRELLERKTVKELIEMARDKELSGYSNKRKTELIDMIQAEYKKAEIESWPEAKPEVREKLFAKYADILGNEKLEINPETREFKNINEFFSATVKNTKTGEIVESKADISEYWNPRDGITVLANREVNIEGRAGIEYGSLVIGTALPDLTGKRGAEISFGFVLGRGLKFGSFQVHYMNKTGAIKMRLHAGVGTGGWAAAEPHSLDITNKLETDDRIRIFKLNRGFLEYREQERLMGRTRPVAFSVPGTFPKIKPPPYGILPTGGSVVRTMLPRIKIKSAGDYEVRLPMGEPEKPELHTNIRFAPGMPNPPRTFRLYDEGSDTLLTEGTYASGTIHYSHPVPVFGYENKTILFRADTSSTSDGLQIEVMTHGGNWRVYDRYTASANTLESYNITGNYSLLRIGYEPSTSDATITDAEVTML